jgi:hypothetical protein
MITSGNAEKAFDKIHHHFMKTALKHLGIEEYISNNKDYI